MKRLEDGVSVALLSAMPLLPLLEILTRKAGQPGIPGSAAFLQHLTLWLALLGATLAARSDRLLSLSTSTFLPERWRAAARWFTAWVGVAVSSTLALASWEFVRAERVSGAVLAAGVPEWMAESILPIGFALLAARAAWGASGGWCGRLQALTGVAGPLLLRGGMPLEIAIGVLLAATVVGLPIFAALGGLALMLFWKSGAPIAAVPVAAYDLVASPLFPSIPLFTLGGYILAEGGASRRLLRVFTALFGWLPGGLSVVAAALCAFFTSFNGASGITILSLGGLLLPVLVKSRYPENFSLGLLTASGSLGLLFFPSLPVILYGVTAQTPIDRLYIGAIVPGLLLLAMVAIWGVREGVRSDAGRAPFRWREAASAVWEAKWELALPAVVFAGYFGGFATMVEAAALTVVYAVVVECLIYRDLSLRADYSRIAVECVSVIGGVLIIVGLAMSLTSFLVDARVPEKMFGWVEQHIHSRLLFLLLLNLFLIVVGALMDIFSAIIVVVPLIRPLAAGFGVEPVQLGIIFLANLELGYLTPPVGENLFLAAYRFGQPMMRLARAALPYWLILLAGVLIVTYVPQLTSWPLKWVAR